LTSSDTTLGQLDEAAHALLTPATYYDDSAVHAAARLLRENSPVHYTEHPSYRPLWILTRHADIYEIETHHDEWGQGGNPFLVPREVAERTERGGGPAVRNVIGLDGDEHRAYRRVSQRWFTPGNLARLSERIAELAKRSVDKMAEYGGACDFAQDIAVHFPLETILSMLGLPEEDYPMLLELSQGLTRSMPGAEPRDMNSNDADQVAMRMTMMTYFSDLTADRRARPTDDLASVIANAEVPGIGEMPLGDAIGYYIILAVAGHETTSASMAGGIQALCENPDQLQRLMDDPDPGLIYTAADEIIRWVTPVKHFTRTAYTPYRLHDQEFDVGDLVYMCYPSANRDERKFEDPYRFDVGRENASEHLAFGFGAHFCLGAQLARIQVRALLSELVPRLKWIALDGAPELVPSMSASGPRTMPIRYELN
jgi:cytochrome P450